MTASKVFLFGKLRALSPSGILEVQTTPEMTPQALREAVALAIKEMNPDFSGVNELQSSAVADAHKILSEKSLIGSSSEFSLLPPVCGG